MFERYDMSKSVEKVVWYGVDFELVTSSGEGPLYTLRKVTDLGESQHEFAKCSWDENPVSYSDEHKRIIVDNYELAVAMAKRRIAAGNFVHPGN